MKEHVVGRHEELGMHQSQKYYENQKQLRIGEEEANVGHLSGDESADNRIEENDAEGNLQFRQMQLMGGLFMHPMHDATADEQLDADQIVE